ncbi:MAG TPA: histidine kinase [Wenzhouxiangella sp.]|nr:histidine kinase [Wenzhouxiangella sp.]
MKLTGERTDYRLDEPLPAGVVVGGSARLLRYRQYPVFSWPWLRGRTLFALVLVTAWASLNGVGVGLLGGLVPGLQVWLHQFFAFMLMTTCGPALATLVRHRRWSRRREGLALVAAVLVGMALSAGVDAWAAVRVTQALEQVPALASAGDIGPSSELAKAASAFINLLVLAVLYALFGGGWALRAWFGERARWQALQHKKMLADLKAQKRQSDLHLSALQAQIEPHFLFNTLASLRALIASDPPAAEQLLDAMTDYLRAAMPAVNHSDKTIGATLGEQLDLCARYLELMRLRLGGRLQYKISAGDNLRSLEFPPLLILTLVENAIKHGIEPHAGDGHIELAARQADNVLTIEVRDNGAGLQPGTTSGVGLANVRAQLQTRFGERAGLELSSADGWTVAAMHIPLEATDE